MRTIYLNSDFRCFLAPVEGSTPIETDIFDGKSDAYIQASRYVPSGYTWTRKDGQEFSGEMVTFWKKYDEVEEQKYQIEQLQKQLTELATTIPETDGRVLVQRTGGTVTLDENGSETVDCGFVPDVVVIYIPAENAEYESNLCFALSEQNTKLPLRAFVQLGAEGNLYIGEASKISSGFSINMKANSLLGNELPDLIRGKNFEYLAVRYTA